MRDIGFGNLLLTQREVLRGAESQLFELNERNPRNQ